MKNRIKNAWTRLPRLSRGGQILRNLVLAAALVLGLWFADGCQPLTEEGALRRMERTMLLEPGVTIYNEQNKAYPWKNSAFILGENYAYTAVLEDSDRGIFFWSKRADLMEGVRLGREPALMPLYKGSLSGYDYENREGQFFCPRGPEGAVRGELTLTCRDVVEMRAEAAPDDYGVYSFPVCAGTAEDLVVLRVLLDGNEARTGERVAWRMDFYRADGTLAETVQGELAL